MTASGSGVDLRVKLGSLELAHPLMNASGTFELLEYDRRYHGDYLADFLYAAYVPKTVTLEARTGNRPPRVCETPSGMINAIGLENSGVASWLEELAAWRTLAQPVIVSVGGNTPQQYAEAIAAIEEYIEGAGGVGPRLEAYELNISCPNVSTGLQIGADPAATAAVVAAARGVTQRPLFAKLTPNVSDVVASARAAVDAGANGLSLINTVKALILDPQTLRPLLGNRTGGLSGPAIKPIALRMVAEVAEALPHTPIIGMGGVASGLDALEFIACGAWAVAVGAANFTSFEAPSRVLAELTTELVARGLPSVEAARGLALTR